MSQPAKQTATVIAAAPVSELPLANTVPTRAPARALKRPLNGSEAEQLVALADTTPAQAVLLSQITGEPLGTPGVQVAERCPVTETGVSDACGLAGAADAHPAAGGAIWALALLPLLGAGGGGGGSTGTTISPNPPPGNPSATVIEGKPVVTHPVNDNPAGYLFDFNSNKDATGSKYSIVDVRDPNGDIVQHNPTVSPEVAKAVSGTVDFAHSEYANGHANPATDPWFYLDETTGTVYLTHAGAAAHCIGSSFTVTIKVEAVGDPTNFDTSTLSFTVTPPTGPEVGTWVADQTADRYGDSPSEGAMPGDYDTVLIGNPAGDISKLQFLGPYHGVADNSLAILVGNSAYDISEQYGANHFEYLTFSNEVNFYGYDLRHGNTTLKVTDSDPKTYYTLPEVDGTTGSVGCNNIMIGSSTDFGGSVLNGESGNDLIFSAWIKTPPDTPPHLSPFIPSDILSGGNGNDLLVGGWGPDQLFGGNGNDVLVGGYGTNVMNGGLGADIFVFNVLESSDKADTIQDFTPGLDDKICLDKNIFTAPSALTFSNGDLIYDSVVIAHLQGTGLNQSSVTNAVIYA